MMALDEKSEDQPPSQSHAAANVAKKNSCRYTLLQQKH